MPLKVKLILTVEKNGAKHEITAEIENEDMSLFQRFLEYVEELKMTKLMRAGIPATLNFNYTKETGMSVAVKLPPWDDVIVLLHKLRPLVLEKEQTSYKRICSILGRCIENEHFRQHLKQLHRLYSGESIQSQVSIFSNNVLLNSEKVLFDWLNAYEFHRDQDKRAKIESLHKLIPFEASQAIFLFLLTDKIRAILKIAELISLILKKRNV